MKKSDISLMPQFFDRYINKVDDISILDALSLHGPKNFIDDLSILESIGDKVYSEGKWTVKQMLQHIIDTERIFAYRAMRISRGDTTPLPGFDENLFAENAVANHRTLNDLLEEFTLVRNANIAMVKSMRENDFHKIGICSNQNISCGAILFAIVGHAMHHHEILRERYYTLA